MIQSIEEYMESRRKDVHNTSDDDHWFTTTTEPLSMYPSTLPWYITK
jgi:hypothetical protein